MAMANVESAPRWSNFAAWSAAGALLYIPVLLAAVALLGGKGLGAVFEPQVAGILGLTLLFSMTVVGLTNRNRPFSFDSFRKFLIRDAAAILICLLVVGGFISLIGGGHLDTMGRSEWVAAVTGAVLVAFAIMGSLAVGSVRAGADLIDDEVAAEELRERGRLIFYSFVWMALCGLLLIGLGFAGPGGLLSPATALPAALVLIVLLAVLGIAVWRLSDELARTLSTEAGSIAFYLVLLSGGGWAMLAHLGFVPGPAPLDWLTLTTVMMFAASFVAAGRRNLLTR